MEGTSEPTARPRPEPRRVLYRCRTPTNFLCPCGAVARRLKKHGLEYRTQRLPYRRRHRAEVIELTKQKHVPVLVDGDEVINDSRRILEYLDWAYGKEGKAPSEPTGEKTDSSYTIRSDD
jgi:glutathione S-transferase